MKWLFRIIVIVAILGLAGLGYVVYPQWTFGHIWEAAKTGDLAALETFVDWPSVREGVRVDAARESLRQSDTGIRMGSVLGAPVGSPNPYIEGAITADVFSRRIRQSLAEGAAFDRFERKLRFTSPTTMVATFATPDRPETVGVVMSFTGTMWRVTRVLLPENDPSLLTLLQSISRAPEPASPEDRKR